MTARQTLTILAEIQDLEARREALFVELREALWRDASPEKRFTLDRELREIFAPALDLVDRVRKLET